MRRRLSSLAWRMVTSAFHRVFIPRQSVDEPLHQVDYEQSRHQFMWIVYRNHTRESGQPSACGARAALRPRECYRRYADLGASPRSAYLRFVTWAFALVTNLSVESPHDSSGMRILVCHRPRAAPSGSGILGAYLTIPESGRLPTRGTL
jgi:hypothetical protein